MHYSSTYSVDTCFCHIITWAGVFDGYGTLLSQGEDMAGGVSCLSDPDLCKGIENMQFGNNTEFGPYKLPHAIGGKETATVIVVAPHSECRQRLVKALDRGWCTRCLGVSDSVEEGMRMVRASAPDYILVALDLDDGSGAELIRMVNDEALQTRAVVLSEAGDTSRVLAALREGASGNLVNYECVETLNAALSALMCGGLSVSPDVANMMLQYIASDMSAEEERHEKILTSREEDMLLLLAKGYSRSEISRLLDISINTVGYYIKCLYEKLDVTSKTEAVFEAVKMGILNFEQV